MSGDSKGLVTRLIEWKRDGRVRGKKEDAEA